MGAGIVPLVISALGAGASAYNARAVAKDQDRAAAAGIRMQAERQREADERVSQEVSAMERSSPEASRKAATDAYLGQLRRTRGQAVAGGPAGASQRYQQDLQTVSGDVQDYGSEVADTLGRISAPSLQRQGEGQGFARLASDLGTISRNAGGDAFLNQLRLNSIRRNPWIDAGAALAGGVADGMASSAGKYGGGDVPVTLDNGYTFTNRAPRPVYR